MFKKSFLLFLAVLYNLILAVPNLTPPKYERGPYLTTSYSLPVEAIWDLQINQAIGSGTNVIKTDGNAGIAYLNGKYYVSKWATAKIYVLNQNFELEDSMSFSSLTTGFRALTTDGTYLYGGAATTAIYKIDVTTKTIVQTLSGAPVAARYCTYDPSADNGNGGFWIGNWSTNITLVKKDTISKKLYEIPSTTHLFTGLYGAAIDIEEAGGPYLYLANQTTNQQQIIKIKPNPFQIIETYNILNNFSSTNPSGLVSGLFLKKGLIANNVTTLLGVLQGGTGGSDRIYGYVVAEPLVGPGYATNYFPANQSQNVPVNTQLKWTNPSGATKVAVYFSTNQNLVKYKDPSALVLSNVLDSVYTPTQNLNYNTQYYWRVVTINSNNDSTNGTTLTFKTEFGTVTTYPYHEGFEALTFPPDGWQNPQGYWGIGKKGTDGKGVKSGNQAARVAYNHATNPAELISPKFQLPSDKAYKISFWWKDNDIPTSISGHDTTFFEISTNNGTTWQTLGFLAAQSTMSDYELFSVNLASYSGQTVMFKWRDVTNKSYDAYGTGLDDVKVEEILPTPNPVVYVSPANKDTMQIKTVNIIWQSGMGAIETGFKVYLSTDSNDVKNRVAAALVKDTVLSQAPTSTQNFVYVAKELNWNTWYYYAIDAYNGQGSTNGSLRSFKTVVDPTVTTFPYEEDFLTNMLPAGWTKGTNSNWLISSGTSALPPKSGQYCLAIKYNAFSGSTVMTPPIVLPNDKDMRISFWWINNDVTLSLGKAKNENNKQARVIADKSERLVYKNDRKFSEIVGADTTFFEISTDNGVTWNVEGFLSAPAKQTEWVKFVKSLTAYKGQTIMVRFRFFNTGSFSAYGSGVDLLTIDEIPTGKPYPPILKEPANNAINLPKNVIVKWERNVDGPEETSYKLYYGTDTTNMNVKTFAAAQEVIDTLKNLNYSTEYYWAVEAINSHGSAKSAYFKFKTMQDPVIKTLPYVENFDNTAAGTNSIPLGWTVIDVNNDGKKPYVYQTNGWAVSNPNVLVQTYHTTNAMDDWAITPPIQLEANKTYKFTIWYTVGDSTVYEKFEVKYGLTPTVAGMTNDLIQTIITKSWDWVEKTVIFTPTQNGDYYFGIHTMSDANSEAIIFDDVKIELALDKDLAVNKILAPGNSVTMDGIIPVVQVKNNGIENATNFSVKFIVGNEYSETKTVQQLNAGEVTNVVFPKWTPQNTDDKVVKAIVEWNDDMYKNNDTIIKVVTVQPFKLVFNFSCADAGVISLYGAEFANDKFYASVWNSTTGKIYIFNTDKELVDSIEPQGYSGSSGFRDLAWDGQYLYGGNNAQTIYKINPTTKAIEGTIQFTGNANVRGIAYNKKEDAFYVGGFNQGATNILLVKRNGTVAKTISNQLATYSLAYDTITPGGPFIWVATNLSQDQSDYSLVKLNAETGAQVDVVNIIDFVDGPTPGGLFVTHEYYKQGNNVGTMVLGGLSQGGNFWGITWGDKVVGNEIFGNKPVSYNLEQNYPNPFNPTTMIRFSLPVDAKVTLKIYNVIGQEVATLVDGVLSAGFHNKVFNANMLSSGMYIYKIEATGLNGSKFTSTKKMLLIK